MKLSELFTKTTKNVPADETSKNAKLLIQAGFIYKEMAGVYAYLPLGLKVLENIKSIVRDEMNKAGGSEMIMTALQRQELWEKTDRWDDQKVDIWFKTELKNGTNIGLAWSHEEPITEMMRSFITSYRDLPVLTYQFQTKLRNELRSKSGIMRGREFVMKDLYSYARSNEEHETIYANLIDAYNNVFERLGIGDITFYTIASGGDFTDKYSHEFQTITEAGEDFIYVNREKKIAVNEEVFNDKTKSDNDLSELEFEKVKSAEVGNIFSFGAEKSEKLDLHFTDEDGSSKPVILGSYGIGITRVMGVIAEHFSDDKGLVWPKEIAPARVYLIAIGNDQAKQKADEMYNKLLEQGTEVLYDDRELRPGEKFADADLIGVPYRVVISDKNLDNNKLEIKGRTEKEARLVEYSDLVKEIS